MPRLGSSTPFGTGYNQVQQRPTAAPPQGAPRTPQGGAFQPQVMSGTANPKVMMPQIAENFSGPVTRHPQYPNFQAAGTIQPWAQQTGGMLGAKTMQQPWNPLVASGMLGAKQFNPQASGQMQAAPPTMMTSYASGYGPMGGWQPGRPELYQGTPVSSGPRDWDGYSGQSRQLTGWWPGGYLPGTGGPWGGY